MARQWLDGSFGQTVGGLPRDVLKELDVAVQLFQPLPELFLELDQGFVPLALQASKQVSILSPL